MAPRSPPSSGSSDSMPCAEIAMQRIGADQIDLDDEVEGVGREAARLARLLVARCGLDRVAGAGAVHEDALLAVRRARLLERGEHALFIGDVGFAEHAAEFGRDRFSPLALFMSSSATLTPLAASARAVASPRPDAPPVMTAEIEELSSMEMPFLIWPAGLLDRRGRAAKRDLT